MHFIGYLDLLKAFVGYSPSVLWPASCWCWWHRLERNGTDVSWAVQETWHSWPAIWVRALLLLDDMSSGRICGPHQFAVFALAEMQVQMKCNFWAALIARVSSVWRLLLRWRQKLNNPKIRLSKRQTRNWKLVGGGGGAANAIAIAPLMLVFPILWLLLLFRLPIPIGLRRVPRSVWQRQKSQETRLESLISPACTARNSCISTQTTSACN